LEAGEKSWTLITANLALEQWKDLFAIPWDIFNPNYIGTNNLIKKWEAKLVTSAYDILQEYNYKIIDTQKEIILENEIQKNIYQLLKHNLSLSIDDFIEKTQYDYWVISLQLALMELNNVIRKDVFGKYEI
jgi:DNA processing protein